MKVRFIRLQRLYYLFFFGQYLNNFLLNMSLINDNNNLRELTKKSVYGFPFKFIFYSLKLFNDTNLSVLKHSEWLESREYSSQNFGQTYIDFLNIVTLFFKLNYRILIRIILLILFVNIFFDLIIEMNNFNYISLLMTIIYFFNIGLLLFLYSIILFSLIKMNKVLKFNQTKISNEIQKIYNATNKIDSFSERKFEFFTSEYNLTIKTKRNLIDLKKGIFLLVLFFYTLWSLITFIIKIV